jgi:hypothetical protein
MSRNIGWAAAVAAAVMGAAAAAGGAGVGPAGDGLAAPAAQKVVVDWHGNSATFHRTER